MPYRYRTDRHRNSYRWRSATKIEKIMECNPYLFNLKQKLYHYTTYERAISILSTNKLFMGTLSSLNDINESYRPLSACIGKGETGDTWNRLAIAENLLQNIRQTSLSIDGDIPGFAIPAMWGHYAEKGEGICIVFDKDMLVRRLKQTPGFHCREVDYIKNYNPNITIDRNMKKYFIQNLDEIFFIKDDCWKYEQEFRIICRADNRPAYVDISASVIAIVMCYARGNNHQENCFTSESYKKLRLLFPHYPILEWSTSVCDSNLKNSYGQQWYPLPDNQIKLDV